MVPMWNRKVPANLHSRGSLRKSYYNYRSDGLAEPRRRWNRGELRSMSSGSVVSRGYGLWWWLDGRVDCSDMPLDRHQFLRIFDGLFE